MAETDVKKLNESGLNPNTTFFLKLSIKEATVLPTSVISIGIKEWIFDTLPRIELEISDSGRFTDQFPLEDNDIIKIELGFLKDDPVVIAEFNLQDYEIINSGPGKATQTYIKMTGLLKTENFKYEIKNRAFNKKTSNEVFDKLFDEIGYEGYEPRIEGLDKMNWLQCNQNNIEFMDHVLKRAFVGKDDSPFLFCDRESTLIYTSLKTEVERKQKIKTLFYHMENSLSSNITQLEQVYNEEQESIREELGSENIMFYRNWNFKNIAGNTNKTNSYGRSYTYYDMSESKKDSIISDDHPFSVHSLKEKEHVGKIVVNDEYGLFDTGNTHPDYIAAQTQNEYVRSNFFSSPLIIYSRPESSLKLFDTVRVMLPTMQSFDSNLDEVHSGTYIVGGIIHQVQKNSIYTMVLILYRNGLDIKSQRMADFESRHSS